MWVCFNDGFVSIVADATNPKRLMVRARKRAILERLFPKAEIQVSDMSGPWYDRPDYLYRVFVPREEVAMVMLERTQKINYYNFKDSVKDKVLGKLYGKFWKLHRQYQDA